MSKTPDRKYVRVYYDELAEEFPEVWSDPLLFWTWCRLLVVAEKMWPSVPEVPRFVRPRAFSRLVDLGIIATVYPHCFQVRGLDAERARRAESARNAARNRWGTAERNAGGNAEVMPRRDETRQDEKLNNNGVSSGAPRTRPAAVEPIRGAS